MDMDDYEEMLYWVWLADNCGAGSSIGNTLLKQFGSPEDIYRQKPEKVASWDFLSDTDRENAFTLLSSRSLQSAEQVLTDCQRKDIHILCLHDDIYPQMLHGLSNAPLLLYCKGTFPWVDNRLVTAVVGTRTMSDYGRDMAYRLGYGLAAGGAIVVSGMALGVDSMAMMGALDAGGVTIAVLGSGVDVIYPKEHTQVYQRILASGGCIISEFIPGTRPMGRNFPIRNRIISGIADCGVVVEGNATSGSLITARHLGYQGKKIFAVPGQVGQPGSEGPNDLIRNGALPVLTAEDILSEYEYLYPDSVHTQAAHRAYHNLDVTKQSQETMRNSGVQVRNTHNFVGEGTYGGRSHASPFPDLPPDPSTMPPSHPAPIQEERLTVAHAVNQNIPTQTEVPQTAVPPETNDGNEKKKRTLLGGLGIRLPERPEKKEDPGRRREQRDTQSDEKKKLRKGKNPLAETEKIQPVRKIDTNGLAEKEMRVYNSMKPNVPMTPDELVAAGGFSIGEVMAAMTMLEMAGVIEAGSGGYFMRIDPDDMPVTLVEDTEIEEHTVTHRETIER